MQHLATIGGPLEIGIDYLREAPPSKMDQAAPLFFNPEFPHNVGDWFLTKIVDRILDFEHLTFVNVDVSDADWDEVNQTCDALVLRGGNYLQRRWLADKIGLATIKKVKIPIILFGAGIQEVGSQGVEFDPEEAEILKRIHDSCALSAVRGDLSAEVLASIGIHNVAVTGCPTLFWSRQPTLALRAPAQSTAGFSFRQSLYSLDSAPYQAQFRAIDFLRRRASKTTVILQGEEVALQYLHQARRWGAEFLVSVRHVAPSRGQLTRKRLDPDELRTSIDAAYSEFATAELISWVCDNTFFSWDILEYLRTYQNLDVIMGCRLHSNLLALANGTPAFYLTYDDRTREVVELLGIPHCELSDFDEEIDVFGQSWASVEKRYEQVYGEMLRFLDDNDLAHRLTRP